MRDEVRYTVTALSRRPTGHVGAERYGLRRIWIVAEEWRDVRHLIASLGDSMHMPAIGRAKAIGHRERYLTVLALASKAVVFNLDSNNTSRRRRRYE